MFASVTGLFQVGKVVKVFLSLFLQKMTERIFSCSVDGREELQRATSLKERTVRIKFGAPTHSMFPLNYTNVGETLLQVVPVTEIVALGCLARDTRQLRS